MEQIDREAEARRQSEMVEVEAISRASEARANFFRQRSMKDGGEKYANKLQESQDEAAEHADRLRELQDMGQFKDPEGTAPTLADIHGNYAPNQEVAGAGGTGVMGSNSNKSGEQAGSAREALSGATVIRSATNVDLGGQQEELDDDAAERAAETGGDAASTLANTDDDGDEGDEGGDEEGASKRRGRKSSRKSSRKAR